MNKNYLLGLVGIVILAAAGWYLLSGQNKTATSGTPAPGKTNVPEMVVGSGSTKETLTFNGSSFDRKVLEVKSGGTLTVVNASSVALQFDSDPHPIHTDNSELNVEIILPGASKTVTLRKTGTWGYHNHLNASQGGKIIVF